MNDSRYYSGGLMRCCIQSILDDPGPDEEGREVGCKYHRDPTEPVARFTDGAWRYAPKEEGRK